MRLALSGRVASTRTNSILYNGDFEVAPTLTTFHTTNTSRWFDGTTIGSIAKKAQGWGVRSAGITSTVEMGFDSSVSHSGTYSMKLDLKTTSAACTASTCPNNLLSEMFRLSPNTTYVFTAWCKTTTVATNAAFVDIFEVSAANSILVTNSTNKLTGTNDWTLLTKNFTTNASTVFGFINLRNSVTGNVSVAWLDDLLLIPATTGRVPASGRVAI